MMKAYLSSLLLITLCQASESGQTCNAGTCADYAATEVAHMEATSDAAVQLLQRQASDRDEGENDDREEIDTDESIQEDFDYEEDDFDASDAALLSTIGDGKGSCDAFDKKYPEMVKVDFDLAENTVNNLGGVGPETNKEKAMYYKNAATGDDGKSTYDLRVTVIGDSYTAKTPNVNGQKGHYGIINVGCGTSVDLKFELLDPSSGQPATLKNLIFSWFDLDKGKHGGGLESVTLWPGYAKYVVSTSSEIKPDKADCPANAGNGNCDIFTASTWGVGKDNPDDPLTLTKQQAARTFSTFYSDVSSFSVTLAAGEGFGSRNFLFTGMSQVAYGALEECCPAHICGCQSSCEDASHMDWNQKCSLAKCADCDQCTPTTTTTTIVPATKEETCSDGLKFELSEDRIVENTLGHSAKDTGRLLFKNVLEHNGRSVDLSITDDSSNRPSYKAFTADGRGYTGAYKTAGRLAFDSAGDYLLKFTMLDSQTGKPVSLPLFPFTLYDVDGKGEIVTACNVAKVITDENTRLQQRYNEPCYSHVAVKQEVNIPADFDKLSPRQKKSTVTYVYRHTASWDLGVKLRGKEKHRYVLFGSSKVLACDYEDKIWDKPWKRNWKNKADV